MPNKRTMRRFTCTGCGESFSRETWHLQQVPLYCSPACRYAASRGEKQPLTDRFWVKVSKNGPILRPELGSCWIWTAATDNHGYGVIRAGGGLRKAHIVAYILTTGHEPPAETPNITHLCDGGDIGCVRPSHLLADTQAGNMAGAVERGRMSRGARHAAVLTVRHGEQQPLAKLTDTLVREIRDRYARGGISQRALAAEYGVSQWVVGRVILRRIWAHVA